MSKVRINDLARELEVKSRQVLDVLAELGLGEGKTHSSSIEEHEAEKVRAHFQPGSRPASHAGGSASRGSQTITPKIDLSHVSKPGDVMKAILAKKQEEEAEARKSHIPPSKAASPVIAKPAIGKPAPPAVTASPAPAAPARPEPRKIVPQPRPAPAIVAAPPAIASKPPAGAVVAKAPVPPAVPRPPVTVVPPTAVVKPPAAVPAKPAEPATSSATVPPAAIPAPATPPVAEKHTVAASAAPAPVAPVEKPAVHVEPAPAAKEAAPEPSAPGADAPLLHHAAS
jgi:translation initiation factor IF-2